MHSMIQYTTTILKDIRHGEKNGWTYIEVPSDIAQKLKPGHKRSFRVKGRLDNHPIEKVSLLPMGNGNFMMPINGPMRKGTGKRHGAMLHVQLEEDLSVYLLNTELMDCLADAPDALSFFYSLSKSHQNYFSKWIDDAKTEPTKAKRIAQTIMAMERKQNYSEMLRFLQKMK